VGSWSAIRRLARNGLQGTESRGSVDLSAIQKGLVLKLALVRVTTRIVLRGKNL